MATLTASQQLNMGTVVILFGTASIATATQIQVTSGTAVQNYHGTFSYNASGQLTGGTLTSTDFSNSSGLVYQLSGGSFNISTIRNYVQSSNIPGLLRYIFAGNDVLNGSAFADVLNGYAGNDSINGNDGNDTLRGGAGNDSLNGGTGADSLIGGLGNDVYIIGASDVVTEGAGAGTDKVNSSISYTLGANLENLTLTDTAAINGTGNALNNILTGNAGDNTLNGGAGADKMNGGLGNDSLNGGAGADSLIGGLGNDVYFVDNTSDVVTEGAGTGTDKVNSSISYILRANLENLTLTGTAAISGTGNALDNILTGNSGKNTLNGGAGSDSLTGGAGLDVFRFNTVLNGSTNMDTITDFSVADDTIQLENAIFTKLHTTGKLAAGNFLASTTGTAADANDYVLYNTTSGALSYDADGNGAGVAVQIALMGISALTSADFMVI